MERLGELAALVTSISWTVAALIMERATAKVGVMAVNTLKVGIATLYLAVLAFVLTGSAVPLGLTPAAWLLVGASGVVGFVAGDYFLLHAYTLVGARRAMLFYSASIPLTALLAWGIFGEALGPWALAGMALAVGGIALTVVAGKGAAAQAGAPAGGYRKGVAFGLASALAGCLSTLLTKAGAAGVPAVAATQVRIASAFAGFLVFALATRKLGEVRAGLADRRAVGMVAGAAVFGPFVGVGCLLYALQNAPAGIVSTLSSLSPVLIIAPSMLLYKKKVAPLEIVGAVVAMGGVALLFL